MFKELIEINKKINLNKDLSSDKPLIIQTTILFCIAVISIILINTF